MTNATSTTSYICSIALLSLLCFCITAFFKTIVRSCLFARPQQLVDSSRLLQQSVLFPRNQDHAPASADFISIAPG